MTGEEELWSLDGFRARARALVHRSSDPALPFTWRRPGALALYLGVNGYRRTREGLGQAEEAPEEDGAEDAEGEAERQEGQERQLSTGRGLPGRDVVRRETLAGAGPGGRWRAVLAVVALLAAAAEVAAALFLDVPLSAAIVVALLFMAGWLLLRRASAAGPILIGLLSAIEVVFTPFYAGHDAADWVVHGAIGAIGVLGVTAAAATLRADRRSRCDAVPAR